MAVVFITITITIEREKKNEKNGESDEDRMKPLNKVEAIRKQKRKK